MDAEEFVDVIKLVVRDAAVEEMLGELERPARRRPLASELQRSDWFNSLDMEQKRILSAVIFETVDRAVFGFLCVVDGVRAIENGPDKGLLELNYLKNGTTRLNPPNGPMLHDLWKS